jgi:Pyruvate/2-oxoacid:ferredoxin oxidoreductase delta subunit
MFKTLCTALIKVPKAKDINLSGSLYPSIDEKRCILCRSCFTRCPEGAFSITAGENIKLSFDKNFCTSCGLCLYICPVSAIIAKENPTIETVDLCDGKNLSISGKQANYISNKTGFLLYSNSIR